MVIVEDDRQGKAAGWQVARETSHFGVLIEDVPVCMSGRCNLEIGMPLRTELARAHLVESCGTALRLGRECRGISPLLASRVTWEHQGALFCIQLEDKMNAMFRGQITGQYGARVRKQLTRADLLEVVYRFYPQGLLTGTDAYNDSEERKRQTDATRRGIARVPRVEGGW